MKFTGEQLRRLIIPLAIQQVLALLVGMLDTVMVSSAGEAALSGVSIVNEVNYLIIVVMDALATGGSVLIAQYVGSRKIKEAKEYAGQLVLISVLLPLLLMGLGLLFHAQILNGLYGGVADDVMAAANTYFVITLFSFPFLGLYDACNALFRIVSRTREMMYTSILMNVINLVGNYIGVFVLKMGVAGVAYPTLISRAIAALIMFRLSFSETLETNITWKSILTWKGHSIKRILSLAIPNALENGLFQAGRIIVTTFIAGLGTTQISANSVAGGITQLTIIASSTFSLATMTVIGQCVGADDYDSAKHYTWKLIWLGTLFQILENLLVYFTLPFTMRLYTMSAETYALARELIVLYAFMAALFHCFGFVLPNALRAAGDIKFTMYVGVLSMFLVRITGAYIMTVKLGMGVKGVWYAMYCDWMVRIVCFVARYKSGKWMNYRVVE